MFTHTHTHIHSVKHRHTEHRGERADTDAILSSVAKTLNTASCV